MRTVIYITGPEPGEGGGAPENLDICAGKVVDKAPDVMEWDLGEAMSDDGFGHVENLLIKLQCDVTTQSTLLDSCSSSPNTPDSDSEGPIRGGFISEGAAALTGPIGNGSSEVVAGEYAYSIAECSDSSCSFVLKFLDLEMADLSIGKFYLTDVRLSLVEHGAGWAGGFQFSIPTGGMRVDLAARVKINGKYPFGNEIMHIQVGNVAAVDGTIALDHSLTINAAKFKILGETLLLTTE